MAITTSRSCGCKAADQHLVPGRAVRARAFSPPLLAE
jgi:hypothetical protein